MAAIMVSPFVPPKSPDPSTSLAVIPQQPRSFSAVVSQGAGVSFAGETKSVDQGFTAPLRRCEWKSGRMTVMFSEEEIRKSVEPLKYALVAKFWGKRPPVDVV